MNPVERALRRVDRYQQRHGWLGFLFAVVKKFGDDKGGNLTTLLAWNGFFALFPLLLILVTTLGFLLGRHPALEQRVLHSTLAEFPIIGNQLQDNVHSLRANGLALVIGLAGFVWGARGITQAGQHAMAELWNIPGKQRPSFATRQLRGLVLLLVFGLGVVATTALASLASVGGHSLLVVVGNLVASAVVNAGLFLIAFRVLTPRQVPSGRLLVGAAVAGVLFTLLQAVGGYLVGHNLKHAQQVYGFFAIVLGLMSWLFLGAQVTLYGAEVNVVRARRLWPRSILQPPLTEADQRALIDLARQEERRPEQASTSSSHLQLTTPTPTVTRASHPGLSRRHPAGARATPAWGGVGERRTVLPFSDSAMGYSDARARPTPPTALAAPSPDRLQEVAP
jgi:YihY family inner membrane protein